MTFAVALGLVLTLDHPSRSYGQQGQGQPGQNPQQGANQAQGQHGQPDANQPQAQQGQPGARQQGGNPGQGQQGQQAAKQGQAQQGQPDGSQGQGQQGQPNSGGNQDGAQQLYNVDPFDAIEMIGPGGSQNGAQQLYYRLIDPYGRNSGMSLAPADDALRSQLKLSKDEGLLVTAVEAGSPAAQAGIQQNDVLLRLGGYPPKGIRLGKPEDLEKGLKLVADGPELLHLLRAGQRAAIMIQPRVRVSLGPVQPDPPSYWIGVSVSAIEPALRSQLQLQARSGLLALDVVKDSPGAKAGIRPHDILLKLDGEDLADQDKLIQVVQARGEKMIPLELVREGKKETIAITPQRRKSLNLAVNLDKSKPATYDWMFSGAGNPGQPGTGVMFLQNAFVPVQGSVPYLVNPVRDHVVNPASTSNPPRDGDPATARRLDDLTAQIKELRQAIEALTKAPAMQKK